MDRLGAVDRDEENRGPGRLSVQEIGEFELREDFDELFAGDLLEVQTKDQPILQPLKAFVIEKRLGLRHRMQM